MTRFGAGLLAIAVASGAAGAAERRSPTRLCPEDLPEGAHLPPQPGCSGRDRVSAKAAGDGFVDLGNGTSVRIGGRSSAEFGVRR